ncbi:hypothetical protein [Pseudoxanthomonas winnipegensis]|uniref:Uncharacterized protein n=1 Tax=Pseudoxanthomonas winnipegensis TaxID=2480810 RepID=A0A4V2HG10_9GAMM|nr:hypothetical protein [Pseudoxanthomonas winnipegensis]TAA43326.1 hypothetical protein EA655_08555 [Pseudoxanthomonas winnipegensis]
MSLLKYTLAAGLLMAAAAPALATELAIATYEEGVIPVLITVNKEGKVTSMVPSQRLKPSVNRLLRETIDQLVIDPAQRNGEASSSQAVIRMKLESVARDDGQYDARFVPIEIKSVPTSAWGWKINGQSYALVNGSDNARNYNDGVREKPSARQSEVGAPPSGGTPNTPPSGKSI